MMMRSQVQYVIANADQVGQRIDNYLLGYFKRVPKTRVYRAVRKGEVRVNGRRVKVTYRIQQGDELRLPPLTQALERRQMLPDDRVLERVQKSILHEDDELIVMNKPANLAVHSGTGVANGIIEILRATRGNDDFLELAHRLDRPTSGCLLIAKTRRQLLEVQTALQEDRVTKQYLCLVLGDWPARDVTVDYKICRQMFAATQKMIVDESGKTAVSVFRRMEALPNASLMQVRIETGRTHQIRVHARAMGHPLAGDERYGARDFNKMMKGYGLKRCFLHAERFEYQTVTGKKHKFVCPLPNDLCHVLTQLRALSDSGEECPKRD